jgi:hypothetical protein
MTDFVALDLAPAGPVLDVAVLVVIYNFTPLGLAPGSPSQGVPGSPVTAYQSYSQVIRDAFFAKAVKLPFFAGFTARRSKQLPIQQTHIPYLGVYIAAEDMGPDGDANAGEIRFIHRLQVCFQVIIENNDPVAAELKLDGAFWAIMNGLWRDPKLTNFINSDMPDNTRIEAIERGRRVHAFGAYGANNEKPYAELSYFATVIYRAEYGATVTDDLHTIYVEFARVAKDGTVPPASEIQRIIAQYEFQ